MDDLNQLCCKAFITQMRLEWQKANPNSPSACPIKSFDQYNLASRVAMSRSIQRVIDTTNYMNKIKVAKNGQA